MKQQIGRLTDNNVERLDNEYTENIDFPNEGDDSNEEDEDNISKFHFKGMRGDLCHNSRHILCSLVSMSL